MLTLLLGVASALACPTIATGTPSALSFDVAQVAIVRQGDRTTFSVSINPVGEAQRFALVMPVPEILAESDITTLDSTIFANLDGYSAPRHVTDAGCGSSYGGGASADTADSDQEGGDDRGNVDVEAHYLVGDYEIVILSADESSGLNDWLDAHGYYLPSGAEPRLAEYIDAGSYFLAAKVADAAATASGESLSPLQISYTNDVFSIPLRLATLNSPGQQDMVIYAINDVADGRVGIANYPEFDVTDKCIWGKAADDDFPTIYEGLFTSAWQAMDAAAWTVEYAGGAWDCNPCSGTNLSDEDLAALGFVGGLENHHLTRLRMRYTPEQAQADLTLYGSGIYEPEVTSYADDDKNNYNCVESFCDGTPTPYVDENGNVWDDDGELEEDAADKEAGGGCGCATGPASGAGAALVLGAVLLARRRRV